MWQTGFLDGKVLVIAATQCRSYYSVHTTKPARISFSSMLMKHKRFWLLLMLYTAMLRLRQARSYSSIISNAVHSSEVCSDIRMRKTFRVNNNEKSYWTRRVSTSSLLSKFQLGRLSSFTWHHWQGLYSHCSKQACHERSHHPFGHWWQDPWIGRLFGQGR